MYARMYVLLQASLDQCLVDKAAAEAECAKVKGQLAAAKATSTGNFAASADVHGSEQVRACVHKITPETAARDGICNNCNEYSDGDVMNAQLDVDVGAGDDGVTRSGDRCNDKVHPSPCELRGLCW
jgi:hypothetical protein